MRWGVKKLARTISTVSFIVCRAELRIPSGLQTRRERYQSAHISPPLPICFQTSKAVFSIAAHYFILERGGGGWVRYDKTGNGRAAFRRAHASITLIMRGCIWDMFEHWVKASRGGKWLSIGWGGGCQIRPVKYKANGTVNVLSILKIVDSLCVTIAVCVCG